MTAQEQTSDDSGEQRVLSAVADDRRIVVEDGVEGRIARIVEPVVEQLGYRLVRIRLTQLNGLTLQIMAERPDGTMSVDDCEAVSRAVSPVLDIEDPIDREYHLELSSPGIDRPLVRRADFEAWTDQLMKLETSRLVAGRKRYRGRIVTVDALSVTIERDAPPEGEETFVSIPFDAIADARLILTDDLVDAALKADKAARKGRAPSDAESGHQSG